MFGGAALPADGLAAGQHYLDRFPDRAGLQDVVTVAKAAWDWYLPHRIDVHAKTVERLHWETAGVYGGAHL